MKTTTTTAAIVHEPESDLPPLDGKTFVVTIPSPNSMTPAERQMAATGEWPVRVAFPSAAIAARAASAAMRDHRAGSSSLAVESDHESQPTLEALLKKLLRGVVQNEITAALKEFPRPQVTPPGTVASVPELLTVNAVAKQVHTTPATVREWIKAGDLKASRVGPEGKARIYTIARADFDDFLHRRRVNPVVHDLDTQADEILQTLDADDGGRK